LDTLKNTNENNINDSKIYNKNSNNNNAFIYIKHCL